MGSFTYVNEDGNKTRVPPTLTMRIDYYDIGCGKDESDLFPCEEQIMMHVVYVATAQLQHHGHSQSTHVASYLCRVQVDQTHAVAGVH